jgi:hypothetical protein
MTEAELEEGIITPPLLDDPPSKAPTRSAYLGRLLVLPALDKLLVALRDYKVGWTLHWLNSLRTHVVNKQPTNQIPHVTMKKKPRWLSWSSKKHLLPDNVLSDVKAWTNTI